MQEALVTYRSYGAPLRLLSEPEILLTQLHEKQEKARRAALLEAQAERKLLGTVAASLSYRTVINTAAGTSKAASAASAATAAAAAAAEDNDASEMQEREVGADASAQPAASTSSKPSRDTLAPASGAGASASARSRAPGQGNGQGLDSIFDGDAAGEGSRRAEGEDGEALRNDFAESASPPAVRARARPAADQTVVQLRKKQRSAEAEAEADAEIIVDLDTLDSSALYASGFLSVDRWDPKDAVGNRTFSLENFGMVPEPSVTAGAGAGMGAADMRPNNTLVVQLTNTADPKRWSVNICPDGSADSHIFLHFNPRYDGKGKGNLVLNDRRVFWGEGRSVPMQPAAAAGSRGAPRGPAALYSSSVELLISVRETGFACFANGQCACFFPHRTDISDLKKLACVLPRCDDNGVVETVVFQKVWWGYRDPALDPLPQDVVDRGAEEVSMFLKRQAEKRKGGKPALDGTATACTLQVAGLPKHSDSKEIQELEKILMDLFEKFKPVKLSIVPGAGVSYMSFPSVDYCLDALDGMQGVGITDGQGQVDYLDIARLTKKF